MDQFERDYVFGEYTSEVVVPSVIGLEVNDFSSSGERDFDFSRAEDIRYVKSIFYAPLFLDDSNLALVSARGAGKTVAASQYLFAAIASHPGIIAGWIGKKLDTAHRVIERTMAYFKDRWESLNLAECKKRGNEWTFDFFDGKPRKLIIGAYTQKEAIRTDHFDLLFMDEAASMPPNFYESIISGLMGHVGTRGRMIALGTPRGKSGTFYKFYQMGIANENGWKTASFPASQYNLIDPEFLKRKRAELGDPLYRQEFECDFDVAISTANIYAELFYEIQNRGQVDRFVTRNENYPCYKVADLGRSDAYVCGSFQYINNQLRFFDCYIGTGVNVTMHLSKLREKEDAEGYKTDVFFLPHDSVHERIDTFATTKEITEHYGYRTQYLERESLSVGISRVKLYFPQLWINSETCVGLCDGIKNARVKVDPDYEFPLPNHVVHESPWCDYAAMLRYAVKSCGYIDKTGMSKRIEDQINYKVKKKNKNKFERYF